MAMFGKDKKSDADLLDDTKPGVPMPEEKKESKGLDKSPAAPGEVGKPAGTSEVAPQFDQQKDDRWESGVKPLNAPPDHMDVNHKEFYESRGMETPKHLDKGGKK